MKLLNKYLTLTDAEDMAERLENQGIVTHISSKRSHSLASHRTGAINVGLWVILENQYQDALKNAIDAANNVLDKKVQLEKMLGKYNTIR